MLDARRTLRRGATAALGAIRRHRRGCVPPCLTLLVSLLTAGAVEAQAVAPPGWRWTFDGGGAEPDTAWTFVQMPPGWHVTMARGGFLFDPAQRVESNFVIESEMFVFPTTPDGAAYGVFAGGSGLEASPDAVAFQLRPDGTAAVIRWTGGSQRTLLDWTARDAILRRSEAGPVKNVIRVVADPDRVHMVVNGDTVGSVPRADAPVDGNVGLRMSAGVNAHVTTLDVTRRLAPPAPRH